MKGSNKGINTSISIIEPMGNRKKRNGNGGRNKRKWAKCPECGAKVRPENLDRHKIKVHGKFYQKPKGQAAIAGVLFVVILVVMVIIIPPPQGQNDVTDQGDHDTGNEVILKQDQVSSSSSSRTVLIETFTSVDCYWCNAEEEPALKKVVQNYAPNEVAIIAYHGFYGNDPYQTQKGNVRANYYGGVSGTPSVWFDGVFNKVGGTGQGVDAMYGVYEDHINQRVVVPTSVSMDVSGTITNQKVQVSVKITEGDLDASSTRVRIALLEDDIAHEGDMFHWVLRDLGEKSLPSGSLPHNLIQSFGLNEGWDTDSLRVVVWVQDDETKEVLQASYLGFPS
jgi:hypothetical protein